MKYLEGNLITLAKEGKFDVIIHGCNCFHTMGAGIAKYIKQEWPEVYTSDLETKKGDINKLGSISFVKVDNLFIVNAYTQFNHWGKNPVDYEAIRNSFKKVKIEFKGKKIGYPLIGCGLAGGDWNIVEKIINEELNNEDHTLIYLNEDELRKARKK
jgi:O-acetyl-ADP-ribose deacetylase (regulator of RNase III)